MAFELTDLNVRSSWKHHRDSYPVYTKTGKPLFGMWRLYIEQIPCEASYNYLAIRGITCNRFQEILLTDSEYQAYIEMLRILGHV